ncbi:MAG TPA: amidase family protein [Caulobacterales bacterium]|jgi:amidase|nr:amidase family protein [Caulobacterales bacterium]
MADTITQDFETASANALAKAVAAKKVSALELTEAAIARIERINPPLNAVIVKDYDRAREQAKAVDARVAKGEAGPLMGVPMTVKESYNIAGLKTTWGFAEFKDFVAAEDALPVTRLKDAGAVILGKTNVPPSLADWQSDNPVYGRTNNPHDLGRSPGGSSGGGAAAVASGMVPLELGSDIGGSIRIPAAFCGIYGHKPTYNLLPGRGHYPPGVTSSALGVLSVIGPLARSIDDIETALNILAVPDPINQGVAYKIELPAARHKALKAFRVLIVDELPIAKADSDTRAGIAKAEEQIGKAGGKVARKSELLPDFALAHQQYTQMLMTAMSRRGASGGVQDISISSHQWLALLDEQAKLMQTYRRLFQDFDVILAPAFGVPAFAHNPEPEWSKRFLNVDNEQTPYGAQLAWPGLATYPGLPATAVPTGKAKDGLPTSMQIIGPYLEDRTPIQLARLLGPA